MSFIKNGRKKKRRKKQTQCRNIMRWENVRNLLKRKYTFSRSLEKNLYCVELRSSKACTYSPRRANMCVMPIVECEANKYEIYYGHFLLFVRVLFPRT